MTLVKKMRIFAWQLIFLAQNATHMLTYIYQKIKEKKMNIDKLREELTVDEGCKYEI